MCNTLPLPGARQIAVRVHGPADAAERAPTVAIHTKNKPAAGVLAGLTARGIAAGAGHFYGYRVVQALGLDPEAGVLRVSFVHSTAPEEIDTLVQALDASLQQVLRPAPPPCLSFSGLTRATRATTPSPPRGHPAQAQQRRKKMTT